MKSSILILTLLISSSLSFAAKPKLSTVVAEVNGIKIRYGEFQKKYKQNLLFVSDKVVTPEKVVNDMINRELGIQLAKKNKIDKNPIVLEKMQDIMYHAQISKDLEPRLKKINVTEADVRNYYKKNPEYRTAHILFRVRVSPDENEWKEALKQALRIYRSVVKKSEKFGEFANKYSQSSTAPSGGDMGFVPSVRMAPEYFKAIKGQKKGYITPPVKTQFGYHIIKVLAQKDVKAINVPLYKKIVYDLKRDKKLSDYFSDLRKNAKISINKGAIKDQ